MSSFRRARASWSVFGAAAVAFGCGTHHADIPQGLLDAIQHPDVPDSGRSSYPPKPYGVKAGSTIENLCFDGWTNPAQAGFDPQAFSRVCLGDYFDPSGSTTKLLLIESCAVWCAACRSEYGGSGNRLSLTDQLAERKSQGFQVLGTIFQGGASDPATAADAVAWAKTFAIGFPFLVDDQHLLGSFSPPTVAPFNMLVDTRSMKIVLEVQGDEPATLFQAVDDFLAKNAGP